MSQNSRDNTGGWGAKGKAAAPSISGPRTYAFPSSAPKQFDPKYAPRIPNNVSLVEGPNGLDQWGLYTAKLGKEPKYS